MIELEKEKKIKDELLFPTRKRISIDLLLKSRQFFSIVFALFRYRPLFKH